MSEDNRLAAVVIGRNEGAGLTASLESVQRAGLPLVYVDSGSNDGSPEIAVSLGIHVIKLDPSRPFSAGRARNEGLAWLLQRWPQLKYVLFLDGDCELEASFPSLAINALNSDSARAIVTGHLREKFPEQSIYNRLCAIEWRSPAGPITNMNRLGGIMVVRVCAFLAVGGFNVSAIAGEEPDLGVRLCLAGHSILKVDVPMATHDAQMLRFGQWWTRAVRSGHAIAHRFYEHGRTDFRDGAREMRSALFWGFVLPVLVLVLLIPTRGISAFLLVGGYSALGWRVYRYYRNAGFARYEAGLVSRFIILGKLPEFLGMARYGVNRLRGEFRVIEYK